MSSYRALIYLVDAQGVSPAKIVQLELSGLSTQWLAQGRILAIMKVF